jgi:hypothetical protein
MSNKIFLFRQTDYFLKMGKQEFMNFRLSMDLEMVKF